MIAVIGCNHFHFEKFLRGKCDIIPEADKEYIHVYDGGDVLGRKFERCIDLRICCTPIFHDLELLRHRLDDKT